MKFELTTTESYYSKEDAEKLKPLGFKFEITEDEFWASRGTPEQLTDDDIFIEINSLEELTTFAKEWGSLVVCGEWTGRDGGKHLPSIEIYNGRRE